MNDVESRSRDGDERRSTPALTIAAFLLLFLIPVLLVAGDVKVTRERITIDLPIVELRGEGKPEIDMGR